jgi:hypothetical protein
MTIYMNKECNDPKDLRPAYKIATVIVEGIQHLERKEKNDSQRDSETQPKGENLRVLQTDDGQFYAESGEGKILYNVTIDDDGDTCTCGDFAKNIKRDPDVSNASISWPS